MISNLAAKISPLNSIRAKFKTFRQGDQNGASAVEFSLLAPIFLLIFLASIDFGTAIYNRFATNGAVSAAANYAILNASSVNSTAGSTLAQNLGLIVANQHAANWANASVIVNNGPTATLTGGVLTLGGTASNANSCYCPTAITHGVAWGNAITCGQTCSAGGIAGKFVVIVASTQFVSIFGNDGIIPTGTFTTSTVLETN